MAIPVAGTNVGNGVQDLMGQIRLMIREELANAARGGIGLHVDGATGNLIIDQGNAQSGNYAAGSAGWALFPTGNAEFNAITLRGGIIGNDALTSPLSMASSGAGQTGITPGATADYAGSLIPVPTGYTRAIVHCTVDTSAIPGAGAPLLNITAVIAAVVGSTAQVSSTSNMTASTSAIRTFTGLSGGTISIAARIWGSGTFSAGGTSANCNAIAVFLR